jgi:hypothetical protein
MKTTAQHLIVIAILALFGITVNAQNTKSFRVHHSKGKFAGFVSERVHFAKKGLSADLKTLEAFVKFKPSEISSEEELSEPLTELAAAVAQLKTDVRYTPTTPNYYSYEVEDIDFSNVMKELEKVVKYNPAENLVENGSEFRGTLKELEKVVKYQPSAIF